MQPSRPILVYSGFEGRVPREASVRDPSLAAGLNAISRRLVDLMTLTRAHYYHPAQKGSWSIKSVLPTIAPDLDYANLNEVADGGAAQRAYLEMVDPGTSLDRKDALAQALRTYCQRDTEAMVRIATRLCNLAD